MGLFSKKPVKKCVEYTATPAERPTLVNAVLNNIAQWGFDIYHLLDDDISSVYSTGERYRIEFIYFPDKVSVFVDDRILNGKDVNELYNG